MSDNESPVPEDTKRKRGRPSKAGSEMKELSAKEAKKRARPATEDKKEVKKSDGASPAKRGRGRPKGSTKKKGRVPPKKASGGGGAATGGRGRGRPKKDEKKVEESAGEDEEEEDEEEEEEGED